MMDDPAPHRLSSLSLSVSPSVTWVFMRYRELRYLPIVTLTNLHRCLWDFPTRLLILLEITCFSPTYILVIYFAYVYMFSSVKD